MIHESTRYDGNRVYIERYHNPADLIQTNRGREPPHPDTYQTNTFDYFGDVDKIQSPDWSGGYKWASDCLKTFEFGTKDAKELNEADSFRMESVSTNTKKLAVRKNMVYGGAVNMGRYLTGNPVCMTAIRRENVPSKILELALDTTASAFVDPDDIRLAGMAVLGAIAKLESMGYKVRVHALDTTKQTNGGILGCDLLVKDTSEILNPSRILFPMSSPAFQRVIMFGQLIRNPYWDDSDGMGCPIRYSVDNLDDFYKKVYGFDRVFNLQELVKMVDDPKMSRFDKARYLREVVVRRLTKAE